MKNAKFAIAAFLAAFIFVGLLTFVQAGSQTDTAEKEKRTIDVSGSATLSANPDKAELYLGVTKQELSASEAQQYVTEKMDAVRSALFSSGISKEDIETTDYSVYPVYDWKDGEQILRGYRATHSIKVTTKSIDSVGKLIDVAVKSGANQVNSVQFGLTDAKTDELRLKAYKEAAGATKKKAQAIADGLGVKLGRAMAVSDNTQVVVPYLSKYATAQTFESGASAAPSTQIDVGLVKVSVDLRATFEMN